MFRSFSLHSEEDNTSSFGAERTVLANTSPSEDFTNIELNDQRDNSASFLETIKKVYFVRVYDFLDFYEDKEINNIIIWKNAILSYRKELTEEELNLKRIVFNVTIDTSNLDDRQYYISVIGAAYINDNVEYFSYDSPTFKVSHVKKKDFEIKWVIPLSIIIFIFVVSLGVSLFKCIRGIKTKDVKIIKELKNEKKEEKIVEKKEEKDEKDNESEEESEEEKEEENKSDDRLKNKIIND